MRRLRAGLQIRIHITAAMMFLLCASPSFAEPETKLQFESTDTLEEIRAKIKHNKYQFTVDHNSKAKPPAMPG